MLRLYVQTSQPVNSALVTGPTNLKPYALPTLVVGVNPIVQIQFCDLDNDGQPQIASWSGDNDRTVKLVLGKPTGGTTIYTTPITLTADPTNNYYHGTLNTLTDALLALLNANTASTKLTMEIRVDKDGERTVPVQQDITILNRVLNDELPADVVNLPEYYNAEETDQAIADAIAAMDLSDYATDTELTNGLATKANTSHTHAISDVTGLQSAIDGKANTSHTHSASDITSGVLDIARIPQGALERLVMVADQTARYALTTATVQNGDCVKQVDDNSVWVVIDDTNLGNSSGYTAHGAGTAGSVPWSGITGKPSTFTPSAHTHPISDVTGLQTALDGKAASSHTHNLSQITDAGTAAAKTASTDGTLAGNSDNNVPTEKAVKTYVDNHSSAGGFISTVSTLNTSRNLSASDRGALLRIAANITLTLTDLDVGTSLCVSPVGTAVLTLAGDTGVTIVGDTTISGDGTIFTLVKIASGQWEVYSPNTGVSAVTPITSATTWYVSTTGVSTNTGLSVGSPWDVTTLLNKLPQVIQTGDYLTVSFAAGTYAMDNKVFVNNSGFRIILSGGTWTSNTVNSAINFNRGLFRLENVVGCTYGTNQDAQLEIGTGCTFAAAGYTSAAQMHAVGGTIFIDAGYTISGGGTGVKHRVTSRGGKIIIRAAVTHTFSANVTFGNFLDIRDGYQRNVSGSAEVWNTGGYTVTATRWACTAGGRIYTPSASSTSFPGTSAGSPTANAAISGSGIYMGVD